MVPARLDIGFARWIPACNAVAWRGRLDIRFGMSTSAIEIIDFSFAYGTKRILDSVSVHVEQGQFISMIGPNGAGKTTLLKCVNRILEGGSGSIAVCGRDVEDYAQAELATMVGYVPQAYNRMFPFRAHEFVMMGRYPHLSPFSSPAAADERAVQDAMRLAGCEMFADRFHDTLSGGERQRVLIAAALAQEAKILLLDEPTTFLDPHHEEDIFALLRRLNSEQGVTVVMVTHDLNRAALASDHILALRDGRAVHFAAPDDLMCNDVLETIYDKRFLLVDHPQAGKPMILPEGG